MNLFQISNELQSIFSELEDNGGELTPELEERLNISQLDFREKVRDYINVIKDIESDCTAIDVETKRLKVLKDSKKKVKERLSDIICKAIIQFGEHTKSGGSYIDLGTEKVSVRKSKSYVQNKENTEAIVNTVFDLFEWFKNNNQLDTISYIDNDGLNEMLSTYKYYVDGTEIENPITLNTGELDNINADVKFTIPVKDMLKGDGYSLIKQLVEYTSTFTASPTVDKTKLKKDDKDYPNLGYVKENNNLIIK